MATIDHVAKSAGVSIKTVSRVMNGEEYVREATKQKVLEAAKSLNYTPNLAARQLAANRSFLICYVTFFSNASYTLAVMNAAGIACRERGYHLVAESVTEDEKPEDVMRRVLNQVRPDGIFLTPPFADDPQILAIIAAAGVRLVRLASNSTGPGITLTLDDASVSAQLATHLVERGHSRIGFVQSPLHHHAASRREVGFNIAMAEAGLTVDPSLLVRGDFTFASGLAAGEKLLALREPPTAIIAANDGMALGVMTAAARAAVSVPDQLAVAGFDDSPGSRMVWPPLTTVRQPLTQMAQYAVRALIEGDHPPPPMKHQLLLRGSTTGKLEPVLDALDA